MEHKYCGMFLVKFHGFTGEATDGRHGAPARWKQPAQAEKSHFHRTEESSNLILKQFKY